MAIIYITWIRKDGKSSFYAIQGLNEEGDLEAIPIERWNEIVTFINHPDVIRISSIYTLPLKYTDRSKQLIDILASKSLRHLIIKNDSAENTIGMQSQINLPTTGFTFFIDCLSKTKDSLIEISLNTQHLDCLSVFHINQIKHCFDDLKLQVLKLKHCGLGKAKHPTKRDSDQSDKRQHLIQLSLSQ